MIALFGLVCFVLGVVLGYTVRVIQKRSRSRPLTENDVLDRFASAYNVKRKPRESDAALRARVRAVMMGGFLLLAGCAHPQPVNPGYQPTAWFVVDGEVWHCDASAKVLCRRFGVATPAEGK